MGDDAITVFMNLNAKGFNKGVATAKSAVTSLQRTMKSFTGKTTGNFKSLITTIVGVGSVIGVLSKSISTYVSQHEELSDQLNAVWTTIGNLIAPIIEKIISLVSTATSYFVGFLNVLGVTSKTASELSKSTGTLLKTVAGFDELNVMSESSGSGSISDSELPEFLSKLAEFIKNKAWDEVADLIIDKFNSWIDLFKEKAEEWGTKCGEYLGAAIHILSRIVEETDWSGIGEAIAKFFNGLIDGIDPEELGSLLVAKFTIAFKILTGFLENLDWAEVATFLSGVVIGAFDSLTTAIEQADFHKIGAGIKTFFENIDWDGVRETIEGFLKAVWDAALDFLWGLIAGDSEEEPPTIGALKKLGEKILEFNDVFTEMFDEVWKDVKEVIETILQSETVATIIEAIANAIGALGKYCSDHKESIREGFKILFESSNLSVLQDILNFIETLDKLKKTYSESGGQIKLDSLDMKLVLSTAFDELCDRTGILGAAIKLLRKTNDEEGSGITEKWEKIKKSLEEAAKWIGEKWDWLKEKFGLLKPKIEGDNIPGVVENIKTGVSKPIETIKKKFEELGGKNGIEGVKDKLEDMRTNVQSKFSELSEKLHLGELGTKILGSFTDIKDKAVNKFKTLKDDVLSKGEELKKDLTTALQTIRDKADEFKSKYDEIEKSVREKSGEVEKSVREAFDKVLNKIQSIGQQVATEIQRMSNDMETKFNQMDQKTNSISQGLSSKLTAIFRTMKNNLTSEINNLSSQIVSKLRDMSSSATSTMQSMTSSLRSVLSGLSSSSYTWGRDLMSNLINGIRSLEWELYDTVEEVAQIVRDNLGFSEPKEGPLSDFHTYGPDMMKLYASSIEKSTGVLYRAVTDVAQGISDRINGGDYSIGANYNAMSSIAKNVEWRMPTVAGGGILPYNISKSMETSESGSSMVTEVMKQNSDILDYMRQILQAIQDGRVIAIDKYKFGEMLWKTLESESRVRGKSVI